MDIIKTSGTEMDSELEYALILSPEKESLQVLAQSGATITITDWVLSEIVDKMGELKQVVSLRTSDGALFATSSPTAIFNITAIWDIFVTRGGAENITVSLSLEKSTKDAKRKYIEVKKA